MPFDSLRPYDLGLILSYKCQSACAHCLYNCGPAWKDWMAPSEVRLALEAATLWGGPSLQVHLTGGEPFLNFELLLQAAEIAVDVGIAPYVETNAGWCTNLDLAQRRFAVLQNAGLQAVLISCSPFHAATIPLARTLTGVRAAISIFGPNSVMVYLPDWVERLRAFDENDTVSLEDFIEVYGAEEAGRMFWQGYGLIPGGRSGYALGRLASRYPPEAFQGMDCRSEILYSQHSHFDLYGNFISGFCGGLTVGDWHYLPAVLKDFQEGDVPQLVAVLIQMGSYGLFEVGRDQYGYVPLASGYVGKCHLCVDVRRHLVKTGDFPELKPVQFYESI